MAVTYDQPAQPALLACYSQTGYIHLDGTNVRTVHTPGLYIRRDGTYVGTVHTSGQDMILVAHTLFYQIPISLTFLRPTQRLYKICINKGPPNVFAVIYLYI